MIKKIVFNIVRVSFKKKRQVIKFIAFTTICFWLMHRYCTKFTICSSKGSPERCLNISNKTITTSPSVNYFREKINLNWQTKNNVLSHVIRTGKIRAGKVFMTIGIPSIKRIVNYSYLIKTLSELESKTTEEDKLNIICVIFLCDTDDNYNVGVEKSINSTFTSALESGFFQVVRAKPEFYPPLTGLKLTFKDTPKRVKWRAKQVADFVFMFRYCSKLGHYHLQLEDDVSTVHGFAKSVERYIHAIDFREDLRDFRQIVLDLHAQQPLNASLSQAKVILKQLNEDGHLKGPLENVEIEAKWTMLEFSQLGFIGKLIKSTDLEMLAMFLAFYYDEQPVDWLIVYFLKNMGQNQKYFHTPALFQHFGLKSSFDHLKNNKLKDKAFNSYDHGILMSLFNASNIQAAINPLALVISDISSEVDMFYVPGHNLQFKVGELKTNQSITFLFPAMQNISNITIETGILKSKCLTHAELFVGRKYNIESVKDASIHCSETKFIGIVRSCSEKFVINEENVSCIVLRISKNLVEEVIFVNFLMFPL